MAMIQSKGGKDLREVDERASVLSAMLFKQIQEFHSLDPRFDVEIEQLLVDEKQREVYVERDKKRAYFDIPKGLVVFSPSSVSKCSRELYFKAKRYKKDEVTFLPYQKRWVRNGSAIHEATQRDLLYMSKHMEDPAFKIMFTKDGYPAWENNIATHKVITHKGQTFAIFGMMDGILEYQPDKSRVGFEYKTKSTTIASVGNFLMKDAQDEHKQQALAYHLLFDLDEFMFMYESLAKDGWMKGVEAKTDIRTFYYRVKKDDVEKLLDKMADICRAIKDADIPDCEPEKAIFCPYKHLCKDCGVE